MSEQTPKIWTQAEIAELSKQGKYGEYRDEIMKALAEGRIE